MGPDEIAFLALAGFGAGLIGSTAGLASLVSYPALLVVGLPPVVANVTNSVGLVGSSIGSISGSRPELRGLGRLVLVALPVAVVGGIVGSVLLL
ncbi:MAG TPA: TSUP family transporter, partial [Ornithinibacter sp.]|nr:TSUP family transporter [Ornithinibacter sp.]